MNVRWISDDCLAIDFSLAMTRYLVFSEAKELQKKLAEFFAERERSERLAEITRRIGEIDAERLELVTEREKLYE